MDRFVRLTRALKTYKKNPATPMVDYAFNTLASVSFDGENHATQWSIVYDPQKRTIAFKTHKNEKRRTLRQVDFNFACDSPTKILKVEEKLDGDVSGHFIEYTTDMNRSLIKSVFDRYKSVDFMKDMPEFIMEIMASYPESMKCQN